MRWTSNGTYWSNEDGDRETFIFIRDIYTSVMVPYEAKKFPGAIAYLDENKDLHREDGHAWTYMKLAEYIWRGRCILYDRVSS